MKIVKLLLVSLLSIGCVNGDFDIDKAINEKIEIINQTKAYENHNHQKGLFSYYLPKDVGVKRSNKISTVLLVDHYEVFMALNVSEIMNDKLEVFSLNPANFVLVKDFTTLNNQNKSVFNTLVIEELTDSQYLVYLKANEMFLVASTPKAGIVNILEKMLIVTRTVEIDKKKVVAQFSNKEEINYQKEVIELFSESVPVEGFLKDIYESDKEDD